MPEIAGIPQRSKSLSACHRSAAALPEPCRIRDSGKRRAWSGDSAWPRAVRPCRRTGDCCEQCEPSREAGPELVSLAPAAMAAAAMGLRENLRRPDSSAHRRRFRFSRRRERLFRPPSVPSWGCSPDSATGRGSVPTNRRGKRYSQTCAGFSAKARRSDFRTRLAASCPDWETNDHMSRDPVDDAAPWSWSAAPRPIVVRKSRRQEQRRTPKRVRHFPSGIAQVPMEHSIRDTNRRMMRRRLSMSSDRSPPRETSRFRWAATDKRLSWSCRKDDRGWPDRSAAEVVVWPYPASSTQILKLRAERSSPECWPESNLLFRRPPT